MSGVKLILHQQFNLWLTCTITTSTLMSMMMWLCQWLQRCLLGAMALAYMKQTGLPCGSTLGTISTRTDRWDVDSQDRL